jgi:formylglycine-generating enzyme required for sulfatase activity
LLDEWVKMNPTYFDYHNHLRLYTFCLVIMLVAGCATASPVVTSISEQDAPVGNTITNNERWAPQINTFNSVDMLLVPAGCFVMGSNDGDPDEQPVNNQCFQKPFWIDYLEVTNAQFDRLGGKAELPSTWNEPNRPRTNIRWFEARDFCALRGGRLPTEAEWEYAARGPDSLKYPWSNDFALDYGVYQFNSNAQTGEVGSHGIGMSWIGALDMSGNVWEWTSTIYDQSLFSYPYTSDDGREDLSDVTSMRVMRGSSWYDGDDYYGRAANRGRSGPTIQDFNIGFRCVQDDSPS